MLYRVSQSCVFSYFLVLLLHGCLNDVVVLRLGSRLLTPSLCPEPVDTQRPYFCRCLTPYPLTSFPFFEWCSSLGTGAKLQYLALSSSQTGGKNVLKNVQGLSKLKRGWPTSALDMAYILAQTAQSLLYAQGPIGQASHVGRAVIG